MWLFSGRDARASGLARYARSLIDAILELTTDHSLEVFGPADYEPPANWAANSRCSFHPVWYKSLPKRVFWEHFVAGREARRIGADLWFSAAQSIPFGSKVRRAVMIHDIIPLLYPEMHPKRTVLYYRFALKYSCRHADLILANSEATAKDLVSRLGANRDRIRVTPLGPGNRVEARDPLSVSDSELRGLGTPPGRFLLTLATLDPRKNLGRLLEAFARLEEKDLSLAVVGAKRPTFDEGLFGRVRELGLEGRVFFLGYVADEDLPALFARAELFVFPSVYEGFGLPVLEAMLLGAPVVCSSSSSLPEVAGDLAVYFDPLDVDSIASGIQNGLERLVDRARWVEDGKRRAAEFSWKRTAELSVTAFEDVVGGG
jgi:glycosyltransferase involved in cell wall biosynthesis